MPHFIGQLRQRQAVAALALEFLILTAARTNEVLGARWDEMDLEAGVWIVPPERMKNGRLHRVPLSAKAAKILNRLEEVRRGEFVFPSNRADRPLSAMAMQMCLRRMKVRNATPHGFRSTFRDWAGDSTQFPRELAEAALAHAAGDQTERAYRRGDALERRRELMEAWAAFCEPASEPNIGQKDFTGWAPL
jgi:integrase